MKVIRGITRNFTDRCIAYKTLAEHDKKCHVCRYLNSMVV